MWNRAQNSLFLEAKILLKPDKKGPDCINHFVSFSGTTDA